VKIVFLQGSEKKLMWELLVFVRKYLLSNTLNIDVRHGHKLHFEVFCQNYESIPVI